VIQSVEPPAVSLAALPIPNSYWVRPGRLLAGEYPVPSRAAGADRIQSLLRAGVNAFIDLTREGEIAPYTSMLPNDGSVSYARWPIVDHSLPQSPNLMQQILDAIDEALAAGRCVYVHCRAGIGRTGTTIACHLIRSGLSPDQALDRLNHLWQQSARSQSWPTVPETDEQFRYVLDWQESTQRAPVAAPDFSQRCKGALIGLVCGDALAGLIAAGRLDLLPFAAQGVLPAGSLAPGADSATTLLAMNSLLTRGGHDAQDQMERYLEWSRSAPAAEVPADFRRALASWQWSRKPNAGTHDPKNLSAHSLVRCFAAALWLHRDPSAALDLAAEMSRTTQQSPVVLDLCRLWTAVIIDALAGVARADLLTLDRTATVQLLRGRRVRKEVTALMNGGWRDVASADADALSVIARALSALEMADRFASGMTLSVDGPAPSATAGALYGTLAGACFGLAAIPEGWQQAIAQRQGLQTLIERFI